jgi:gas vesicle protein
MRMLKRFFIGAVIGAVIVAVAAPLAAQNLADVARAEEARRKAVKGQAKVYTNDTLRGADGSEPPAPPQPAAAAVPAAAEKSVPPPGNKPAPPRTTEAAKDEKYWRDRLAGARDALSRSQTFADALQSQINALYTEFVNMDDPIQRSVIEKKRLAAIAEQDRVKADIVRQTKAIADVEDEARRANVPAGWLR